ncbi:class 1 fructose-bisphosphatase [bacterium DOLJORAL78_65_58]|nr:MAG: class 1 fructose-bisphosphatase [bacterium DOLZORAL124_64_63]PIE76268.1 MAG: class 1 fructose-bisphosphatase [bacterium DOLJORAL78_65_58]
MTQAPKNLQTIESHILEMQTLHPSASGDFTGLLSDIAFAAKVISREVNKAGLVDILGATGDENIQGEVVQKLDEFGNNVFIKCLGTRNQVCIMGSEELDDPIFVDPQGGTGSYIVVFDPLDGSSNIDANVSVGTIFGIWKRNSRRDSVGMNDLLQSGNEQVAAGYVIYGSSTMFVYTAGHGVHGFTLDPSIGEFLLSHEHITTPFTGKIYSVNEAYEPKWDPKIREVVRQFKYGRDTKTTRGDSPSEGAGKSSRYIGSLVADFHRNLLYGGVYLYPPTLDKPEGKLRLMCEAAPLAMIAEAAGGYASDGKRNIMEIVPTDMHMRVPLYIGSRGDVMWIESMLVD